MFLNSPNTYRSATQFKTPLAQILDPCPRPRSLMGDFQKRARARHPFFEPPNRHCCSCSSASQRVPHTRPSIPPPNQRLSTGSKTPAMKVLPPQLLSAQLPCTNPCTQPPGPIPSHQTPLFRSQNTQQSQTSIAHAATHYNQPTHLQSHYTKRHFPTTNRFFISPFALLSKRNGFYTSQSNGQPALAFFFHQTSFLFKKKWRTLRGSLFLFFHALFKKTHAQLSSF